MLPSMFHSHERHDARRSGAQPRWVGVFAALVVVLGVLAGSLHHHAGEDSPQHPCVVCSLHHTPATPVVVAEPAPPAPRYERVPVVAIAAPRTISVATAPARAPPEA